MFATMSRNFILFSGLILFSNAVASDMNPFMSEFQEIYQNKLISYPILNHKEILFYDEAKARNLTGKGTKILVIDGNNAHAYSVVSLINDSVCGIAPGTNVVLKQHIFYRGCIDESLPVIIKENCSEGIDFISLSFSDMFREFHSTWQEAFLWAKSQGVGILMSAGNDSKCLDNMYPGIDAFLKKMDRSFLFVLASEYEAKTEKLAQFSNYPNKEEACTPYCITAPGVRLLSKDHLMDYQYFGGTSGATPLVTAAALVKEANPSLSSQQVLDCLYKSARKKRLSIDINKEDHEAIRILNLKAALNFKSE